MDYEQTAILLACERACTPNSYILRCADRCGAQLICRQRDTMLFHAPKELAWRALKAGWHVDADGSAFCPDCRKEGG